MFPVEVPTKSDGDVYTYVSVDAYSRFAIYTGVEKDNSFISVLKHIKLLIQHKDFIKGRKKNEGFTLVLHKYEEVTDQINEIIQPFGGSAVFNDPYLTSILLPFMQSMFESLAKHAK